MVLRSDGFAVTSAPILPCPIIEGECAPVDKSAKNVCASLARTSFSLIKYLEPLSFSILLFTSIFSISLNCIGPSFSVFPKVIVTSAIFFEGLLAVPEKITSSIPEPRMLFAEVSPIHHLTDSTIFDLPQPLGPTIPVKPFSIKKVVFSINDLKPIN